MTIIKDINFDDINTGTNITLELIPTESFSIGFYILFIGKCKKCWAAIAAKNCVTSLVTELCRAMQCVCISIRTSDKGTCKKKSTWGGGPDQIILHTLKKISCVLYAF